MNKLSQGIVLFCVLFSVPVFSAPYDGQEMEVEQPDGTTVIAKGYGDEYYGRYESLDGYTLIRDCNSGWLVYADVNDDSSELVPTDVAYDHRIPTDPKHPSFEARMKKKAKAKNGNGQQKDYSLGKRLRIRNDVIKAKRLKRKKELHPELYVEANDSGDGTVSYSKTYSTEDIQAADLVGSVVGLTIIVEFQDTPCAFTQNEVNNFCNQVGYTTGGNNGSVYDYYYDVSGGMLEYTNIVAGPVLLDYNKAYYEGDCSVRGERKLLITEAITKLCDQGFDFSSLTLKTTTIWGEDPVDTVQCLNIFYAGGSNCGWAKGLWPHRSTISNWAAPDGTIFHEI